MGEIRIVGPGKTPGVQEKHCFTGDLRGQEKIRSDSHFHKLLCHKYLLLSASAPCHISLLLHVTIPYIVR